MKKIKSLFLVIVVMMLVSIMNVDAADVSIKSIKLVDSTGDATELSEPTTSGLNINFDLAFKNKDDSVKYEVVLNNPTNTEYEINTDKQFTSSNYISYSYELKDKTNRIKANSEVVLYIVIKYENPVPTDKLVDGKYIESNNLGITLLNEKNPDTFSNILLLGLILLVLVGLTLIIIKSKKKSSLLILIVLLLVPVTVFALEKIKLTINTKITVGELYDVYYQTVLIKSSEIDNGQYLVDSCNYIINIDNEEYYYCFGAFRKSSRLYMTGERVRIEPFTFNYLNLNICDGTALPTVYDNNNYLLSQTQFIAPTNPIRITCPKEALVDYTPTMVGYFGVDPVTEIEYDDLDQLNFKSIKENYWMDEKFVVLDLPNEFTMPNHNVMIGLE